MSFVTSRLSVQNSDFTAGSLVRCQNFRIRFLWRILALISEGSFNEGCLNLGFEASMRASEIFSPSLLTAISRSSLLEEGGMGTVSPLETETSSHTTPNKLNALSSENLPESVPTTSNSEHSKAAEIPQFLKRNSRIRRKRPKVQKPEIEIKMAPHRPRKAALTELTNDDEDMITYEVEKELVSQILWADTAARSMSDHMQRPVCYQDLKTSTQNYIHRVWQETWDQQILNKLHSIHPSTSHWAALPVRRHDVRLTRHCLGHTRFTHRHLLLAGILKTGPHACPFLEKSIRNVGEKDSGEPFSPTISGSNPIHSPTSSCGVIIIIVTPDETRMFNLHYFNTVFQLNFNFFQRFRGLVDISSAYYARRVSGPVCVRFFNIIANIIGEFSLNYGSFMGDQDKSWAPHVVCSVCVEELRQWFKGKKKSFHFAVPMIWREPKNHRDDCYFCSCSVQGFNLKNREDISYPTIIRSAIRPVPHGPDLPIPSPPDTLDNILDDLDQILPISSDSDDGYDPGTNDPELFSQSDLNDLVRDLGLPKDTAEVLGSRLKERHLLNSGVSFSWYRFREKEFVPFYARGGPSFLQQCTCNFGNVQNYV
ncbi:uncharacterized protein TNCV_3930991 [Trichonephila clavipes]|nr:uncharacterized protein TNCV_3930991 [Trichonephila clavipes]